MIKSHSNMQDWTDYLLTCPKANRYVRVANDFLLLARKTGMLVDTIQDRSSNLVAKILGTLEGITTAATLRMSIKTYDQVSIAIPRDILFKACSPYPASRTKRLGSILNIKSSSSSFSGVTLKKAKAKRGKVR